jgi:hypothetical protein
MLMTDAPPVVAGTVEDAFASQVTRELPGWDAETDDVLVCRLVRDETHDVKTFVFPGSRITAGSGSVVR